MEWWAWLLIIIASPLILFFGILGGLALLVYAIGTLVMWPVAAVLLWLGHAAYAPIPAPTWINSLALAAALVIVGSFIRRSKE